MNQGKFRVAAFGLLAFSLSAASPAQPKGDKPSVTAAAPMPKTDRIAMSEFKKLLAANNVVTIDVRSSDAYQAGHIPGALSMPEDTLNAATAEKLKRMGKPVATYCS